MTTKDDPRIKLGQAIRARRIQLKMSQEDLAHKSQIHVTYLSQVENGKRNLALLNLACIAKALDLTLSQLMSSADL